ncbi:MAG: phage holin family protein [Nitriliruptorales bacterium]|nr:phage holin family protein [Nitriliruptorales bacterium]
MGLIIRLVLYAAGVWAAVQLVDGLSFVGGIGALLGVAVLLAIVNMVVKPILTVLSLPLVLLTLGLFLLVVNALAFAVVIWLSGQLDLGLSSTGFGATFLGALVVTVVTWLGEAVFDRL